MLSPTRALPQVWGHLKLNSQHKLFLEAASVSGTSPPRPQTQAQAGADTSGGSQRGSPHPNQGAHIDREAASGGGYRTPKSPNPGQPPDGQRDGAGGVQRKAEHRSSSGDKQAWGGGATCG